MNQILITKHGYKVVAKIILCENSQKDNAEIYIFLNICFKLLSL